MSALWAVILAVLAWLILVDQGDFDGGDLAGACRDNRGVQQVVPTTFTAPYDSRAVVVCKDGDIEVIR